MLLKRRLGSAFEARRSWEIHTHLVFANQVNVFVLRAAGKQSEAQESERFLLQNSPKDPQHYVELAQLQAQQGDSSEAIQSWQRALQLFEDGKDSKGAASTHLSLASAITSSKGSNKDVRETFGTGSCRLPTGRRG